MNAKKQRTNCRAGTVERSESIPPNAPLYLQTPRIKVRLKNSIDNERICSTGLYSNGLNDGSAYFFDIPQIG